MDERDFKPKKEEEVDEKKPITEPDEEPVIKPSTNDIPPDNEPEPEYSYLFLI